MSEPTIGKPGFWTEAFHFVVGPPLLAVIVSLVCWVVWRLFLK